MAVAALVLGSGVFALPGRCRASEGAVAEGALFGSVIPDVRCCSAEFAKRAAVPIFSGAESSNVRMNLLSLLWHEIAWYGLWWFALVAIAYCGARYFGWNGMIGGAFLICVLIVVVDVNWIFEEMRKHPERGRDADFIFWFGVIFRLVVFNVVLLPVTVVGLKVRRRRKLSGDLDFRDGGG